MDSKGGELSWWGISSFWEFLTSHKSEQKGNSILTDLVYFSLYLTGNKCISVNNNNNKN